MSSKENLEKRFHKNLERVRHLLQVFRSLYSGAGRPPSLKADVVRAAVVFLHATLEDLLRSSEELRFPVAPASAFERVRWVLPSRKNDEKLEAKERLSLAEFAAFRGQTVDEVLLRMFQKHHEQSNYNNQNDVVGALQRMGLELDSFQEYLPDLQAMMKRRHEIAHRADVNRKYPHLTNRVIVEVVERWLHAVQTFGSRLLASL